MASPRQLCTFRVDDLLMGVPANHVQEVLVHQPTTKLPLADSIVRGLINLRGEIVTAICLRRRMGIAARGTDDLPMNLVIDINGELVSLLVDAIGDVIEVSDDSFELTPDHIAAEVRDVVVGVYKLDNDLLLALDTPRAVELPDSTPS